MKDKKDLRNDTKSTRYLINAAKVIAIITAVVFLITLSRGTVNAAISKEISNQYQDKQLGVLKKYVNTGTMNFIGKLIVVGGDNVVSKSNQRDYKEVEQQLTQRQDRKKAVNQLYDGKSNYQDDVTKLKLDELDRDLLKETNQDVYQVQKNRLDTIRIWFEQTNDAEKYINDCWSRFEQKNSSLSIKKISMINTYNKLVKNKHVKEDLQDKVNNMNQYFNTHGGDDSKVQKAKQELEALKNSPLTEKYKPASVDIISELADSSNASDVLSQAGITDKHVLYLDKSKGQLSYMTLTNGNYVSDGGGVSVQSSNVGSGQFNIKAIISSASSNAAIVTDHSSSSYGRYLANATTETLTNMGISDSNNSTGNWNTASPVFWLKNNSALSNSIYFGASSSIGFIYAGGSGYSNGIQLSSSDLSAIKTKVSTGLLLFVK